jgi:hypothetical protein
LPIFFGTSFYASAFSSLSDGSRKIQQGEAMMKKLALGIATAAVLMSAAAPAMAQVGFYAGPGGVGVGVGAPGPYYGNCGYYNNCGGYYDYYGGGPGVVIGGGGWHGHPHFHGGGHHR